MEKIKLEKKLKDTELACQIAYSYDYITNSLTSWELNKALASWRLEIYSYLKQAQKRDIDYILHFLSREGSKAYWEVLLLNTEHEGENTKKENIFLQIFRIKNKKENNNEKIYSSSSIHVRENVYGSGYSRSRGGNKEI